MSEKPQSPAPLPTPERPRAPQHIERFEKLADAVKHLFESEATMLARVNAEADKHRNKERARKLLLRFEQRARMNRQVMKALLLGVSLAIGKLGVDGLDAEVEAPAPLATSVAKRHKEKPAKKEDWSWVEEAHQSAESAKRLEAVKKLLTQAVANQGEEEAADLAELSRDLAMRMQETELLVLLEHEAKDAEISRYTLQIDLYFWAKAFGETHHIDPDDAYGELCEKLLARALELELTANGDGQKLSAADRIRFAVGDYQPK
jgi:hypothetical protein